MHKACHPAFYAQFSGPAVSDMQRIWPVPADIRGRPAIDGTMAQILVNPKSSGLPSAALMATLKTPVSFASKAQNRIDAKVHTSEAEPAVTRSKPPPAKSIAFKGPVSIGVPNAGTTSRILEQDGKFIVLGGSEPVNGKVGEQSVFLARFDASAIRDPRFGQGGSVRIILFANNNLGNNSPVSALSPGRKIVIANSIRCHCASIASAPLLNSGERRIH